mmetsp:Transcript_9768/g.14576  ORF Transcript_9768/g.14576 Transcript_9768/m.14576 type:complete len:380 (-) Transcript_9768:108-1247(-)
MDMVSFPVDMAPSMLRLESNNQLCEWALTKLRRISKYNTHYPIQRLAKQLSEFFLVMRSFASDEYIDKFCGMLSHYWLMIRGPSGLHAQFTRKNVDSITLKPIRLGNSPSKVGRYDAADLCKLVRNLVYVSSNLHEELHHSYFFYILLGGNHFMAVTEYGLVAVLMLLSILLLFIHFAESVSTCSFIGSGSPGLDVCCRCAVLSVFTVLPYFLCFIVCPFLGVSLDSQSFMVVYLFCALLAVDVSVGVSMSVRLYEVSIMAALLMSLLVCLSTVLLYNYPLGLFLWSSIILSVLGMSYAIDRPSAASTVLVVAIAAWHSPLVQMFVLTALESLGLDGGRSLLLGLHRDWLQFGSYTLPVIATVQGMISSAALSIAAIHR